jgi:hypothetical protein
MVYLLNGNEYEILQLENEFDSMFKVVCQQGEAYNSWY